MQVYLILNGDTVGSLFLQIIPRRGDVVEMKNGMSKIVSGVIWKLDDLTVKLLLA
jgi:hypothetical protein